MPGVWPGAIPPGEGGPLLAAGVPGEEGGPLLDCGVPIEEGGAGAPGLGGPLGELG